MVSEQGDTKRAIGVYGATINIAARMEEVAKEHNVKCAISGAVAENLIQEERLILIGKEKVRGSKVEIPIYQYRVAGEETPRSAGPARCGSRSGSAGIPV